MNIMLHSVKNNFNFRSSSDNASITSIAVRHAWNKQKTDTFRDYELSNEGDEFQPEDYYYDAEKDVPLRDDLFPFDAYEHYGKTPETTHLRNGASSIFAAAMLTKLLKK